MVQFVDEVGNRGSTGVMIDWIDNDNPIGVITYSPNGATSGDVVARLTLNKTGNVYKISED
jgi:hypothetical protein